MQTGFIQEFERSFADLPLDFHSFAKRLRQVDSDLSASTEIEQKMLLRAALIAVQAAEREISRQKTRINKLESLSITDETTGLLNRRGFQREISRALAASKRGNTSGILVICDLDGFKAINDRYGHAAGDAVLAQIAELLHQHVRKSDAVGRMGGDEFAILMTDTTAELAAQRAHELEKIINSYLVRFNGETIPVRASFGLSVLHAQATASELYQTADSAMYAHKRTRNRIPA